MHDQQQLPVQMMNAFDPYLYQTLLGCMDRHIVVQTTWNPIQGTLRKVMPDHIVIEVSKTPFYVRTQEIVWVTMG